jgi:hypothetical protein
MVNPGSPTKKPYSALACNLSKGFKGDYFAGRKTIGDRNAALDKEGKLCVQVLYPYHSFTDGLPFTTFYIKVVQYMGGRVLPVWYCNKNFFKAEFEEVLNITKDVDIGSE